MSSAGYLGTDIPIKEDEFYGPTLALLPSLDGQCVAITGCTSGTGYWAAVGAARKGASSIIMLNRKSDRSAAAEKNLKEEVRKTGRTRVLREIH